MGPTLRVSVCRASLSADRVRSNILRDNCFHLYMRLGSLVRHNFLAKTCAERKVQREDEHMRAQRRASCSPTAKCFAKASDNPSTLKVGRLAFLLRLCLDSPKKASTRTNILTRAYNPSACAHTPACVANHIAAPARMLLPFPRQTVQRRQGLAPNARLGNIVERKDRVPWCEVRAPFSSSPPYIPSHSFLLSTQGQHMSPT